MKILHQLLVPYSVQQFLEDYWTQQAIHISATDPRRFYPFFSWKDLNYLLNYHQLGEPDLQFSNTGKGLPATRDSQVWTERLRQGATLIINGVHHRVPTVAQLAADLRGAIGYETHINLYCSPAEQQGFDCHYDTHDVFILQVDGEKQWFVYRDTVPYPTSEMVSSKESQPTEPPYLECVLKPGDLLYIPRGHWHYAIACGQPSLHLTVGIECQTGLDWLGWLSQELQGHSDWRQSLPPAIDHNRAALKQRLSELQQQLLEVLQQPEILERYIDALNYWDHPPLPVSLPAQMGGDIFPDLFMTQFTWSPLHRIRVKQLGNEHYQIQVGSKQVNLKQIPPDLMENLFNHDQFSLADLAEWAPDLDLEADITPLLTRLIIEGVLQVQPLSVGR